MLEKRSPPQEKIDKAKQAVEVWIEALVETQFHRWRISRIRGTPVEFIGYVEAENEKQAIKQAIKQFQISAEKQKWLVAHRVVDIS